VLLPQGPPAPLASPFPRPLRVRHHGQLLDLPACEAEGSALPAMPAVRLGPGRWHVQNGPVDLVLEDASFDPPAGAAGAAAADELRVPFNGKVIAVHAQPGATVRKGDTLVVVESMKLEHALGATRDGRVLSLHVAPGQQVATAQVLVTFEAR
jgi:geranyl-CoA carboxylase alpha subunit